MSVCVKFKLKLARLRGLLYGTDLNSLNLFCDVIFSLMRKLCYTQYRNYKKIELQGDTVVEW
jgi:hypothetical protein